MKKQKYFNFNFKNKDNYLNFYINKTNEDAYNGVLSSENFNIFLSGPKKSGKSFLSKLWSKKYKALMYDNNLELILNHSNNIIIDQKKIHNHEENIFHILNHCNLNNLRVLFISELKINEINIKLKDLNSRLKIFTEYIINKPDDDMLLNILTKLLIEKQFVINSHEIFNFIIKRANRSYEEIYKIANKLDLLSLEKKRQLTIPLIKEIL